MIHYHNTAAFNSDHVFAMFIKENNSDILDFMSLRRIVDIFQYDGTEGSSVSN